MNILLEGSSTIQLVDSGRMGVEDLTREQLEEAEEDAE
jgi:hypothetical protein